MIFDSFQVEVKIEENELSCEIKLAEGLNEKDLTYAFYLLHNGKKLQTSLYTQSNRTQFILVDSGVYRVMGFVRKGEDRATNMSREIEFISHSRYSTSVCTEQANNINISIFGSCVSRDLLEYDLQNQFKLKTYIARQSIVSAVEKPIAISMEDILLDSKFQRQCVYNDFRKNAFDLFKADDSDYLIIDLIDERFKLIKLAEIGSLVTYSTYLQESNYINDANMIDKKKSIMRGKKYYVDGISLENYLEKFCSKIKSIYKEDHIIIHKCKMAQFYIDKEGVIRKFDKKYLSYNKHMNELLEYMYCYLECYLSKAVVINISDEYLADEKHKWGLSPMHYQEEYYIEAMKILSSIPK